MKHRLFLLFWLLAGWSWGQSKQIVVNNHLFLIKTKKQKNEWNTYDEAKELYRLEKGKKVYLLTYFSYKDEGGDCNNLFWNKEHLEVNGNRLIFMTHYFQKNPIDPIPEWRKQIYTVTNTGKLVLIYDKYKYYHQTEWKDK